MGIKIIKVEKVTDEMLEKSLGKPETTEKSEGER